MKEKINKYYIDEKINNSLLSSVYIVSSENDSKSKYVLKKMNMNSLDREDKNIAIELFNREKEALTLLNNSNIIKYIDSFEYDDQYYLVTEFDKELKPLNEVIQSFSDKQKFEILLNILSGFIACHNKKIIHRDIKPSNILISNDGSKVKIIDFGISKIKDSITFKTSMTLREFKTSPFASPEQKKKLSTSEESDIYSLGILINYIFTDNILNTDDALIQDEISKSSLHNLLKPIVIKATMPAREDRYSAVDVLYDDIQKAALDIEHQNQVLKLTYSNDIPEKLYSLEKIQGTNSNFVQKFILESLKKSKVIFMGHNQSSYLIGNEVKYRIKFVESEQVIITGVWNLDNFSQKQRGTKIGAKVEVYPQNWKYIQKNDFIYLEYLKEKLENQYRIDQIKRNEKNSMSDLLTIWDDYLKRKKYESYLKTNLGRYLSMEYSENSNFLDFKLERPFEFEPKDKIQLVSKNGKELIVGEFYKYLTKDSIRIIAARSFNKENFNKKGQIGVNNYMATRLTNSYSNAMRQLLERTSVNTFLFDILNNPRVASSENKDFFVKNKFDKKILDSTVEIIENALSTKDLYLVQGPPGTGKTTLISEMISQLFSQFPEKKVLFVSPSHVAVDHALKDIRKNMKKVKSDADNYIVRLGKEEKISSENESLQMDKHSMKWAKKVKKESLENFKIEMTNLLKYKDKEIELIINYLDDDSKKNREQIDDLITDEHSEEKKLVSILKDWYLDLSNSEQFEKKIIENSFLVCSTCSGIASYDIFDDLEFEWVIIDEAARSTVPELLIPLVRAKKAILVGDHKQLPPIVNLEKTDRMAKDIQQALEESLFKDLYEKLSTKLKVTLDVQFRMNPVISKLINNLYYQNITIEDYFTDKDYVLSPILKSVTWIDTNNSPNKSESKEENSFKNYEELNQINKQLDRINDYLKTKKRKKSVGIISGYDAQKNLLLDKVNRDYEFLDIEIDNVDAFQGSEKDIIIYSIVRSNDSSSLGFLKDERRLNVSLSRAKEHLIIIGDSEVSEYYPLENNPFTRLLKYIIDNPLDCALLM